MSKKVQNEGFCGDFGRSKPTWVFLVFIDDEKWTKLHFQYYSMIQNRVKTIDFQFDFIRKREKYVKRCITNSPSLFFFRNFNILTNSERIRPK